MAPCVNPWISIQKINGVLFLSRFNLNIQWRFQIQFTHPFFEFIIPISYESINGEPITYLKFRLFTLFQLFSFTCEVAFASSFYLQPSGLLTTFDDMLSDLRPNLVNCFTKLKELFHNVLFQWTTWHTNCKTRKIKAPISQKFELLRFLPVSGNDVIGMIFTLLWLKCSRFTKFQFMYL